MTVLIGKILPYGGALGSDRITGVSEIIKGVLAQQSWLLVTVPHFYPLLDDILEGQCGRDKVENKFNVPDLRGHFVRGVDGEANRDPDRNTRKTSASGSKPGNIGGSKQEDQDKKHDHKIFITGDHSPFR